MAESIGKLLECSICLEQMVLPKILPCFHTFCLACLCKIESKENKLQCPECRKVHNLPNDGAKGFNNNYRLAALIDDLHTVPSAPPLELECQPQVCPQKPEIMSQHSNNSEPGLKVRALYDYEAAESDELNFKAGDVLEILEDEDEQGWCKVQKDGKIGLCPANLILNQTFEIEESDEEVIPNDLSGEKKNQLLEKPTSLTSDDGSSTRMTPSPVPLNRSDSDRTDWDGLNLSLTAREMRERIGSRKKSDPRREKLDMRTKYEIIQTRLGTNL